MPKLKKGKYLIVCNGGHSHLFNGKGKVIFESRFMAEIFDILSNSKAAQLDTCNFQVQ